jgi:methylmalonyl-CoA/ethylmalonyl-CoA epimerase
MIMGSRLAAQLPEPYTEVDQVLWVVSDLEHTIEGYAELGFSQVMELGETRVSEGEGAKVSTVLMARANLGGALVDWIQPVNGTSPFTDFHNAYGDGAMSLVHRFPDRNGLQTEIDRLGSLGIKVLKEITLHTSGGELCFTLMDTEEGGKFVLGFTHGEDPMQVGEVLSGDNRLGLAINQYAFAIRDPEPVSSFWNSICLPEFQINHPELGETRYYGKLVDHRLIQGWQRHGTISYEWCIPVKPPIVYEDHIRKHGEGIHHLAFTVQDMDKVLDDYQSRGYVVSMGGTWGEKGKPGSGRYEYIDLEETGGVTMELLWSFRE